MNAISSTKSFLYRVAAVFMVAMMLFAAIPANPINAAAVTYNFQSDTGTTVATGVVTNDAECTIPSTVTTTTLMSTTASGCTVHSIRPTTSGTQNILDVWFNTAYASATTVTGTSLKIRLRESSGLAAATSWTAGIMLMYVSASGTITNFTGTEVTQVVGDDSDTNYIFSLAGQAATVPAGSKLGIKIRAIEGTSTAMRIYYGSTASTIGGTSGVLIVDEKQTTTLTVAAATGTYAGTTDLSATLTNSAGSPISGKTISFTLNGSSVGSAPTDASGVASLPGISLTGINAGNFPTGVAASFAGDTEYVTSNGTNSLTVDKATPTLSVTNSPVTYTGSPQAATVVGSVDGVVSNIQYDGSSTVPTNAGTYAVTADFVPTDTTNYNNLIETSAGDFVIGAGQAQVDVHIAGDTVGNLDVPLGESISDNYGVNDGPVHVSSTNGMPIFTSERAIFGESFNSIVGYPGDQLTTDYWFTSYDDVGMITYLVIGNPHPTDTAEVDVFIGGVKRNATPYSIGPGQRIFPRFGINGGPVHVVSTNNVPIFTSERTKFGNSFNEVMGYPGDKVSTEFWFTSYDDKGMITYLVIGNPDEVQTAEVDVYIGGTKMNAASYQIGPGQRLFPRFGINGGPVRVVSTNGVDIFTSERTKFGNTFNEVMGYPGDQVSTEFWFTSYDDTSMITFLVVGNPHPTDTAEVDVYIGGNKMNTTPYQIAPGQRVFPRYGINAGPVHVVSTNGVDVFASERSKYLNSFNEILGIADNQLATDYWFTSYDDVGMTTFLVISAPE